MNAESLAIYKNIREAGGAAYYPQKRGIIEVWGKEAVQFLDGLITNSVAKLEDGAWMRAAFPNAKGRLLALVRVVRRGDRYLFETEEKTHETVFQNLFRFTYAGDFFVEDLSDKFSFFSLFGFQIENGAHLIVFQNGAVTDVLLPEDARSEVITGQASEIPSEVYDVLRIEEGIPLYGVDMDETTIVPEVGLPEMISYNKGCYIGQEIIARIHFRGHVAKQLRGLIFEDAAAEPEALREAELVSADGKNAGKITSAVFSPKLERTIALAYVRYDYLGEGTQLSALGTTARVSELPFIK